MNVRINKNIMIIVVDIIFLIGILCGSGIMSRNVVVRYFLSTVVILIHIPRIWKSITIREVAIVIKVILNSKICLNI